MDEYLFIVMAKLRADQARLEREVQGQAASHAERMDAAQPARRSHPARGFNVDSELSGIGRERA